MNKVLTQWWQAQVRTSSQRGNPDGNRTLLIAMQNKDFCNHCLNREDMFFLELGRREGTFFLILDLVLLKMFCRFSTWQRHLESSICCNITIWMYQLLQLQHIRVLYIFFIGNRMMVELEMHLIVGPEAWPLLWTYIEGYSQLTHL